MQGDEATVLFPKDEGPTYTLRRVGGRWRVPMAELCRDIAADERLIQVSASDACGDGVELASDRAKRAVPGPGGPGG